MAANQQFSDQELLLAEALVKIVAIERLLTRAGVFTETQLLDEVKSISSEIVNVIKSQTKEN